MINTATASVILHLVLVACASNKRSYGGGGDGCDRDEYEEVKRLKAYLKEGVWENEDNKAAGDDHQAVKDDQAAEHDSDGIDIRLLEEREQRLLSGEIPFDLEDFDLGDGDLRGLSSVAGSRLDLEETTSNGTDGLLNNTPVALDDVRSVGINVTAYPIYISLLGPRIYRVIPRLQPATHPQVHSTAPEPESPRPATWLPKDGAPFQISTPVPDYPEICKYFGVFNSNLIMEAFAKAQALRAHDDVLLPNSELPECCSITKLIRICAICAKMKVFVALFELLMEGLKVVKDKDVLECELVRLYHLLLSARRRRKAKAAEYLRASAFSPHSKAAQIVGERESDTEEIPDQTAEEDTTVVYPDGYEAAKQFFTTRPPKGSGKPSCVYPHVVNLFSSSDLKNLICDAFRTGCHEDNELMTHFSSLYDAFFNRNLTMEIHDMIFAVTDLGRVILPSVAEGTRGVHIFYNKVVWRFVAKLYDYIASAMPVLNGTGSASPESDGTHVKSLRGYIECYPTMESLMDSPPVAAFLRSTRRCVNAYNSEVADKDTGVVAGYTISTASHAILKINHCICTVLGLLYKPETHNLATRGLEDALKLMALSNIDPLRARKFLSALERHAETRANEDLYVTFNPHDMNPQQPGNITITPCINILSVAGPSPLESLWTGHDAGERVPADPRDHHLDIPRKFQELKSVMGRDLPEICRSLAVIQSSFVDDALEKALNTRECMDGHPDFYQADLKSCGISRAIWKTSLPKTLKRFVLFYELLIRELAASDDYSEVRLVLLHFYKLFISNDATRTMRSLGYLCASASSPSWGPDHVREMKEIVRLGYNVSSDVKKAKEDESRMKGNERLARKWVSRQEPRKRGNKRPAEIPLNENGNFESARRFFTSITKDATSYAAVYSHAVNFFISAEFKELVRAKFKQGCNESEELTEHFMNLYGAFFNLNLPLEIEDVVSDIRELTSLEIRGESFTRHRFFLVSGMWRRAYEVFNMISGTVETISGGLLHDRMMLPPSVGEMLANTVATSEIDALLESTKEYLFIDDATDCARTLTASLGAKGLAPSYTVLNATYEILKINYCMSLVLSLLYRPGNADATLKALQGTMKQMALHNIDPVAANDFLNILDFGRPRVARQ